MLEEDEQPLVIAVEQWLESLGLDDKSGLQTIFRKLTLNQGS
jgi:hypothetical protein